jgi:hypothetical protein
VEDGLHEGRNSGRLRTATVEQVQAHLRQLGTIIAVGALEKYRNRNVTDGWELPVSFEGGFRETLYLLLDRDFPFSRPLIGVSPARYLQWPHVESDGILCTVSDASTFDPFAPVALVDRLLGEAATLVEACLKGELADDFRNEFYSYWNRTTSDANPRLVSIISSFDCSRQLTLWRGNQFYLVADNEPQATSWLRRRFSNTKKALSFDCAGLVLIPKPLLPSEYPKTGSDVYRFLQANSQAMAFVKSLVKVQPRRALIILAAPTPHGPALAPIQVSEPNDVNILGRKTAMMEAGFRPGHVPETLQLSRFFANNAKSQRLKFERADARWIHGRGKNVDVATLQSRRVAIFGIGSLGGFVAEKIASAGVGHIELVDPETLTFANAGRHILGVDAEGQPKATSVAELLQRRFPHSNIIGSVSAAQQFVRERQAELESFDLLVSTVGDWAVDSYLNEWQLSRADASSHILFGWLEAHALAGHAVLLVNKSSCLRCHFNALGQFDSPLTIWPERTQIQEPACGGLFQPYGPVDVGFTTSTVASLAIADLLKRIVESTHRIFSSDELSIRSLGGSLTETAAELRNGLPPSHALAATVSWSANPDCPRCQRDDA